jgi:hypothetical protein
VRRNDVRKEKEMRNKTRRGKQAPPLRFAVSKATESF